MAALLLVNSGRTHHLVPQVTSALVLLWVAVRIEYAARLFLIETAGGRMAGIARNIELYNSAYSLAWKHVSELHKREKPNIASRLHDSIQREIKKGATEALVIASEALRDVEFNPETWD